MNASLRVAGWGTLGFALAFFATFAVNSLVAIVTNSPDFPTATEMASDFAFGVVFSVMWCAAGVAIGVAAQGLSAVVWPDGGLAARIAAGFGVIASAGWLMSGITALAQRTPLLNGNIAGAGAEAAAERAVVELGFIGVHAGAMLFAFAALPWLAIVAVGGARTRRLPVLAIVFLWLAAVGPIAGFLITGVQFGLLVVMVAFAVVGAILLRRAGRRRDDDARQESGAVRSARPPLRDDVAMDLAITTLIQVLNWPLAALLAWRAVRGRVPRIAAATVVVLLASSAVAAFDPASLYPWSRVAIAIVNTSMAVLFALYPDGRFVPRWIVIPAALEVVFQAGNLVSGLQWEDEWWWPWHFAITWVALLFGGQLYRYLRRSSVSERERTRWPLLALTVMVFGFTLWSIAAGAGAVSFEGPWFASLLLALPAPAFAIGLLAPRLIPVDRSLRAVVGVGVWLIAVSLFAWGAAAAADVWIPDAAAWSAAIATAVAALPIAAGARRLADLVVFGRQADALRTLERLGDRLAASVDPGALPDEIVATVTGSLALTYASLDVTHGPVASAGTEPVDTTTMEATRIHYQGERIAILTVAPRRGESSLTARDRAAIAQICRQAAPALHGANVVGELIQARSRVIRAREEERKRLRRDLHDELAPTFAGLGLSAAAVETFTRVGDARASDAAAQLVAGLQAASRQLREVAYDLRPPVLDDEGLVAALRERIISAGSSPEIVMDAPSERLELPAAVESAAYRITQEAVMNVRRHAAASRCRVVVAVEGIALRIEVTDDGVGVRPGRAGVGLRSMRERAVELGGSLELLHPSSGGTTVIAYLPLGADALVPATPTGASGIGR